MPTHDAFGWHKDEPTPSYAEEQLAEIRARKEELSSSNPKDLIGVKKCPLRLVPPALEIIAAPAMAEGGAKYGPFNWRGNKVLYTVYLEALKRHLDALIDREDVDPRTGVHHVSYLAADIGIIADAMFGGNLIDDRPPAGPAARMLAMQDKTGVK